SDPRPRRPVPPAAAPRPRRGGWDGDQRGPAPRRAGAPERSQVRGAVAQHAHGRGAGGGADGGASLPRGRDLASLARSVTRDGGAGRRGRSPLRFGAAEWGASIGRRARRLIGAPTAPPPPRCAIRPYARAARLSPARREQAGGGLSSLHVPRRDEGARRNGTSPAPP